jgi:hypothetical protein
MPSGADLRGIPSVLLGDLSGMPSAADLRGISSDPYASSSACLGIRIGKLGWRPVMPRDSKLQICTIPSKKERMFLKSSRKMLSYHLPYLSSCEEETSQRE